MTVNEFIKACEKAGCDVHDGQVRLDGIVLGTYGGHGFDVMADAANESLRHYWQYEQVDLNTFKVLLKDLIISLSTKE